MMQKLIINITEQNYKLLEDDNLECFILNPHLSDFFISQFIKKAQEQEKLVLVTTAQSCLEYGADGILIDLSKSENIAADYKNLTQGLKGKFIGAICRNRRHETMLVGECEPDFIVFRAWIDGKEKVQDLTSWFNEMFLLQSALLPVEEIDYSLFKTDFVILDDIKYFACICK